MKTRNHGWRFLLGTLALVSFCFVGCSDDNEKGEAPFDPGKPVVISDFTPKEGGLNSRLVIYGDNFGNDVSKVKVRIGGKESVVIGVKNQSLHCFIPAKAFDGDIEITILNDQGEELAYAEAAEKFVYQKNVLVTTFLGTTYENNTKYDVKDGPFDDCGGFDQMGWMVFDPNDPDMLYICGNTSKKHRIVNFKTERVESIKFSGDAADDCNVFEFSKKGELVVVRNATKDGIKGIFFYNGQGYQNLTKALNARGCRAAATHPINGEIYTTRYDKGWIGRYDPETDVYEPSKLPLPYSSIQAWLMIHPTGKYMYMTTGERNAIFRSNYDEENKTFTAPYLACGKYDKDTKDWKDDVGGNARLRIPRQGCFVKNPKYAGKEDEYDFYFCDRDNHCIRILTPEGKVNTFAGRPNGDGTKGYNDGALRTEARFNEPVCIVYDEKRECFYVGDNLNRRIRKIALEE
ncbi:hypothetical protein D0T60_02575 [Bacteroides sp. 224]|nr:hypothetical protein [Bacteroides sp. 224]